MSTYNYIDISIFFTPQSSECNKAKRSETTPLSELCPRALYRGSTNGPTERISRYPLQSLIAGTVTIGRKDYLRMSWKQQVAELEKACIKFGKKKGVEYVAFIEATKNQVPHLHMLIYNCYPKQFIEVFGRFGGHNKNAKSFKPVVSVSSYVKYITKEYKGQDIYFTNMPHKTNLVQRSET